MQTGNLREKYFKETRNNLKTTLKKKNIYEVPSLEKIVVNTSFGKLSPDGKMSSDILNKLTAITGQKPVLTNAKKAIAGFKIRKGQKIGVKVTLRGEQMYHFFEKLTSITLPRLRDFRGVSERSFDGRGNYTLGFYETNIFPEVEYTRNDKPLGLEITICTDTKSDDESRALLEKLGMPFAGRAQSHKKSVESAAPLKK
jgi:large subunit ribosomal protein L5